MKKVFIDGQEGTTGLQIYERIKERNDIELIEIPHEKRKDVRTKSEIINSSDLVILCLPDEAAKESVRLVENPDTGVIDASTAFRTDPSWVYGLPEFNKEQREKIRNAKRVSNPGCYPTGFILSIAPLVDKGILSKDANVSINAISGYSGGGKKLIEKYENTYNIENEHLSVRPYALGKIHKHIAEMHLLSGLVKAPVFVPSVGNFYKGMLVVSTLFKSDVSGDLTAIYKVLSDQYRDEPFVTVKNPENTDDMKDGFLSATDLKGTNKVDIFVFDQGSAYLLIARLDNLGKGASGAAVQNLNIMLGFEENMGL